MITTLTFYITGSFCQMNMQKRFLSGNDSYANLTLIDSDVQVLIHATKEETINKYLALFQQDKKQLAKINKLRNLLNLIEILQ